MQEVPDVLYHYTSLESFALILKNKTLRFSRLDTLDDPQERRSLDSYNLAKTKFVSCWTACAEESIPMWREYAGAACGVRIELPIDPFARYCWTPEDVARATGVPCEDASGGNPPFPSALIPFEDLWNKGLYVIECAGKSDFLHEVEYTDEQERLFPKTLDFQAGGGVNVMHGKIGTRKATPWRYQNEWRYVLTVMPFDMKSGSFDSEKMLAQLEAFITDQGEAYTPRFYDLKIADSAFGSMKVTASPKMSHGNRVILESLLEKYNPKAVLVGSRIEL